MAELSNNDMELFVDMVVNFLSGEISPEDKELLLKWVCNDEGKLLLFERLIQDYSSAELLDEQFTHLDEIDQDFMESVFEDCVRQNEEKISFWKKNKTYFSIAAGILILVIGTYFLRLFEKPPSPTSPDQLASLFPTIPKEAKPALTRTAIHIGNDEPITLENFNDTISFSREEVKLKNGKTIHNLISYRSAETILIETPTNSKVTIQLTDGSYVNIYPESSLSFPIQFRQNERLVKLTGEAVFDIQKKINHQPFKVEVLNCLLNHAPEVKVLGTSFWINTDKENFSIETGVLSGMVEVKYDQFKETLKPGNAAITSSNGIKTREFNVESVLSKKYGKLSWDNEDIKKIIFQMKKWYQIDLDIDDEFDLNRKFTVTLDPDHEIYENLKILFYLGINVKLDTTVIPNMLYISN